MTTLVAYQGEGWCAIGADTQQTFNGHRISMGKNKITLVNGFVIAIAGSGRTGDVIKQSFKPAKPKVFNESYLVNSFLPAFQRLLVKHNLNHKDSDEFINMLVAYNGTYYEIASDLSIMKDARGIDACGSGDEVAIGAIAMAKSEGLITKDTIRNILSQVLNISSQYSNQTSAQSDIHLQEEKK